jgi:two-component system response regulator DesR
VLIADGHKMFRQGVARLLADVDDIVVAAEVQDDAGVLQALKSHRTDVAVFAQSLPERGGIR